MLTPEHIHGVLEPRAIAPEVYAYRDEDGRPRYASFNTDEGSLKRAALPFNVPPWWSGLARQQPGIVINRWGLDGGSGDPYPRFDSPVFIPGKKPAKYLDQSSRSGTVPQVVDVHPLARPSLLSEPEEVFFVLEGSLKGDALLSFLLHRDAAAAVMSVRSVTLWRVPDALFHPYRKILRKAKVVQVIPDSNYLKSWTDEWGRPHIINPMVRYQTDGCVAWLREQKIRAKFVVPPYLSPGLALKLGVDRDKRWNQGIDDHLAHGGNLDKWNANTNPLGCRRFAYSGFDRPIPSLGPRDRGYQRDLDALKRLTGLHGTDSGLFRLADLYPPDRKTDASPEVLRKTAQRAYRGLVRRGVINVWRGVPIRLEDGRVVNDAHLFSFNLDTQSVAYNDLGDIA